MPSLPEPVAVYFSMPSDAPVPELARAFSDNATVRDERQEHQGLEAIRRWRIEVMARTPFTARALSVEQRSGALLVPAEIAGAFPGSPLVLEHRFTLRDGRVTTLEIL